MYTDCNLLLVTWSFVSNLNKKNKSTNKRLWKCFGRKRIPEHLCKNQE